MFTIFRITEERGVLRQDHRRLGSDSYTFIWVRFGESEYSFGGIKYYCRRNELLFIPPGCPGFELHGSGGLRELITIQFSPAGSEAARMLPILSRRAPLHWSSSMPELLLERLLRLTEQWTEHQAYFAMMCAALLAEVLVIINREIDEGMKKPSTIQHTERMKRYIDDHYREKITKQELSAAAGISPNYAAAMFRKVTGMTISEFVHLKRIKTALYLLKHSQLTIQDISEQLGYSDPSFFHRTFKRLAGKLPSDLLNERSERD